MSRSLATSVVLDSLNMATEQRKPERGVRPPLRSVSNAYDNAMCERVSTSAALALDYDSPINYERKHEVSTARVGNT